jgi:hypothetical protein
MRAGRAQSRQMRAGTSRVPAQMWLRSSQCLTRKRRRERWAGRRQRPWQGGVPKDAMRCDGAAEVQPESMVHRDANEPSRGAAHADGLRASEQASKQASKQANKQTDRQNPPTDRRSQGAVLGGTRKAHRAGLKGHRTAARAPTTWQHARQTRQRRRHYPKPARATILPTHAGVSHVACGVALATRDDAVIAARRWTGRRTSAVTGSV